MFQIITFFLFFFGNAQCCALRLLILECNKWDDLLLIRMTEKTMHSRLEEVFIFGCSVMLCHLGNFLFWAARGSVAPTPRRVAFQATVVCRAQKKKRQKKPYPWKSKGMPQQSTHPCSFRINPEHVKKFLFFSDEIWWRALPLLPALLLFCSCYTKKKVQ